MKVRGCKMAGTTSTVVILAVFSNIVAGYYCDNDKCTDDEYCCGYNLCCKSYEVWDLWYFWCGLLFFMFLLSMCGCLWKLRSRSPFLIGGYPYAPLSQEQSSVHACNSTSSVTLTRGPDPFSQGNPPSFSHCDLQDKSPSPPPTYAQVIAHRELYN